MKFSYNWIKEYVKTNLDAKKAAELLSAKSFEVKEVTAVNGDTVFDIDILPNRPDALSHIGIARDLAALTGDKFSAKKYNSKPGAGDVRVKIEEKNGCPRYSALIVRGVQVGKSPEWLRKRLESLGLKSINNIVDATNYVMLETGQPLHAFDLKTVNGITVRRAQKGERLKTLDEAQTEYELDQSMLVIADVKNAIAIAGIKGGLDTGITDATVDILLEAANFAPESIRATSRKLRLRTDASIRFSYGVDPELTVPALLRSAELIAKVASGKTDDRVIDVYSKKRRPVKLKLSAEYVRRLLGEDISGPQIAGILKGLGFGVTGAAVLSVEVPSWRLDVSRPEDLIEEVGRVYGYENIVSKAPSVAAFDDRQWVKEETDLSYDGYESVRERNFISNVLASIGFSETYNYSLLSDELKESLGLSGLLELESPASHEYKYLRRVLVPRMLLNIRDNFRFFDDVRLFETGHIFFAPDRPDDRRLAMVIGRKGKQEDLFFELKGVVDLLMHKLGIADHWYDDTEPFGAKDISGLAIPGRYAEIKDEDGKLLGGIGILRPELAERLKIKGNVAFAEFGLIGLIRHFQEEREFEPLPKYPSIVRDISLLVKPEVRIADILNTIESADSKGLVRDVDVFDIYEPSPSEHSATHTGEEERAKSVAFHVLYRADDHTLTDSEAESVEKEIKRLLQEKLDAELR